jgi:phosphopantetheinyl transferase
LFYQQEINATTKLAIWKIEEDEIFFLQKVPLKRDISHPRKRLQHLAGRFLLPFLYPDFPSNKIIIADSDKPFLKDELYHFSISHSDEYAAAIISRTQRVGIDVERFSDKVLKVKNKFLNENESIFASQYNDDLKLLTTLWCAKEAAYKWYSYGAISLKNNISTSPFLFNRQELIATQLYAKENIFSLSIHSKLFSNAAMAWIAD